MKKSLPFFVLAVVFMAYLPCLRAGFVNWDDDAHLLSLNFCGIWTSTVNHTYIPLTTTTWAIEHHFFGYNPFVFHLDNVLLHLAVTALVLVFSRRMGLSPAAAALAALLFGIHPVHVESVAWITERKDVLYAVFYMAALLAYWHYLDCGRRKYFWLTLLLGVFSICAKPMAISLPGALLILDWFRKRPWTYGVAVEKVFCAALLVPVAFVTYFINSYLVQPATGQGPFIWAWCFVFYLHKFLEPWPLILFYGLPHTGSLFYLDVLAFVILLAMLWVFRRNRLLIFAFAFYFANIFFLLRFHPFLSLVSDRYMYLSSVGICIFLASAVEQIFAWARNYRPAVYFLRIGLGALVVMMAAMTWRQCEVWQSSVTLWQHQLEYDSGARWLAYYKLADAYAAEGNTCPDARKFNRVLTLYKEAIVLKPDYREPYSGIEKLYRNCPNRREPKAF